MVIVLFYFFFHAKQMCFFLDNKDHIIITIIIIIIIIIWSVLLRFKQTVHLSPNRPTHKSKLIFYSIRVLQDNRPRFTNN